MKQARKYSEEIGCYMEQSLAGMPVATAKGQPLPASHVEILSYVEQLLTPDERKACERATD